MFCARKEIPPLSIQDKESFWKHVDIKTKDECWPWRSEKAGMYGYFNFRGKRLLAHRVSWVI